MFISDICIVNPPRFKTQAESLDWLAAAYARYQKEQSFSEAAYRKLLSRVACNEDRIATRRYFLPDFDKAVDETRVFHAGGLAGARDRQNYYHEVVETIFEDLYVERARPDHLIHVSCTGYVSPSGAQLVAARQFPETLVTHAYHMGCAAAFPALRMAAGFLRASELKNGGLGADIVHTELCTLQMNPTDPLLEQMVIQSLFADGVAAYHVGTEKPSGDHFEIEALGEFLIPGTAEDMQWIVSDQGMAMTLSKDVPSRIASALRERLMAWEKQSGLSVLDDLPRSLVAVHPGGPKIIDAVAELLELREDQVTYSHQVLRERGNMSSATVPHIWEKMLKDPKVPDGTPVLSMAFGPGLTLCLSRMILRRGQG